MDTIRGIRAGARVEEIEECYRTKFADFARLAMMIVGDRGRGYDVVQEAFATAIRKRRSFKRAGRLVAWFCRIVINHAKNARRGVMRHRGELFGEVATASATSPVSISESRSDQLRPWFASLPERQRLAL